MIAGLVLAGGEGSRFGGAKLLAELGGRPLVEHPLATLRAAGLERIVLVAGADAERIRAEVDLEAAEIITAEGWAEGQSATLATGVAELADAEAIVVLLGDQPLVSPEAINRVIGARAPGVPALRATYDGLAAHPTLFERRLFPALLELRGDIGARELLAEVNALEVPCDGLGSPLDVDTPSDLERARAELATARGS